MERGPPSPLGAFDHTVPSRDYGAAVSHIEFKRQPTQTSEQIRAAMKSLSSSLSTVALQSGAEAGEGGIKEPAAAAVGLQVDGEPLQSVYATYWVGQFGYSDP